MAPQKSRCDLIIIGAGPAGLLAAAWASRLKLKARILDDKPDRVLNGRADGLHVRTLEILDSFGLANAIIEEACQVREICSWNPDLKDERKIQRTQRVLSQEEDLGRFPQANIHQGFIEQKLLDFLDREGRVKVERNIETLSLDLNKADEYPISLRIRQDEDDIASGPHIIEARYLIGADGGHSWTRSRLDLEMEGDKTKQHFGVIDIVPITDFPDARISCSIHSHENGSLLTIPREGRLVRFYVQLAETGSEGDDFDASNVTPEMICEKASKILGPYKLEYEYCDWWSVYAVGQQCATTFDVDKRVFLVGDAVHTHSPTMGAGMNVSMQDSYNLVWKLDQVIRGIANPEILSTYHSERHAVATDLIEMDRKMSKFFIRGPGTHTREYDKFRDKFRTFLTGVGVQYARNVLVPPASENVFHEHQLCSKQYLASKVIVGQRLPSYRVISQGDANIVQFADLLKSDGRWRVIILPGDISDEQCKTRFEGVCECLARPSSFIRAHTPSSHNINSIITVLTVHAASRKAIELLELPDITHPFEPKLGYNYWKCFANNNNGEEGTFEDAYEKWGVDKEKGCIVVVRPDQHVALLIGIEDVAEVEQYFNQILVNQQLQQ